MFRERAQLACRAGVVSRFGAPDPIPKPGSEGGRNLEQVLNISKAVRCTSVRFSMFGTFRRQSCCRENGVLGRGATASPLLSALCEVKSTTLTYCLTFRAREARRAVQLDAEFLAFGFWRRGGVKGPKNCCRPRILVK